MLMIISPYMHFFHNFIDKFQNFFFIEVKLWNRGSLFWYVEDCMIVLLLLLRAAFMVASQYKTALDGGKERVFSMEKAFNSD